MSRFSLILGLWPGLSGLVRYGRGIFLILAVGFGLLASVSLFCCGYWTELIAPESKIWIAAGVLAAHLVLSLVSAALSTLFSGQLAYDEDGDRYLLALDAYLAGELDRDRTDRQGDSAAEPAGSRDDPPPGDPLPTYWAVRRGRRVARPARIAGIGGQMDRRDRGGTRRSGRRASAAGRRRDARSDSAAAASKLRIGSFRFRRKTPGGRRVVFCSFFVLICRSAQQTPVGGNRYGVREVFSASAPSFGMNPF